MCRSSTVLTEQYIFVISNISEDELQSSVENTSETVIETGNTIL